MCSSVLRTRSSLACVDDAGVNLAIVAAHACSSSVWSARESSSRSAWRMLPKSWACERISAVMTSLASGMCERWLMRVKAALKVALETSPIVRMLTTRRRTLLGTWGGCDRTGAAADSAAGFGAVELPTSTAAAPGWVAAAAAAGAVAFAGVAGVGASAAVAEEAAELMEAMTVASRLSLAGSEAAGVGSAVSGRVTETRSEVSDSIMPVFLSRAGRSSKPRRMTSGYLVCRIWRSLPLALRLTGRLRPTRTSCSVRKKSGACSLEVTIW